MHLHLFHSFFPWVWFGTGECHWHTPMAPSSLSLLKLRWHSRGQCISLPPSTAHVFSTWYAIYRMYAKGRRGVPRTLFGFFVFWTRVLLCLTLHQRAARRSLQIYTDEKTGGTATIRTPTKRTNPCCKAGRPGVPTLNFFESWVEQSFYGAGPLGGVEFQERQHDPNEGGNFYPIAV